jgi:hypothetical protein
MDSTLQIRFQVALRHSLNTAIGVGIGATSLLNVKLQHSMPCRAMAGFANVPERKLPAAIVSHREADSVAGAILRKPRTTQRVSKIATFVKFVV